MVLQYVCERAASFFAWWEGMVGTQMFQSKERERRFKREQRANKLLAMSGLLMKK